MSASSTEPLISVGSPRPLLRTRVRQLTSRWAPFLGAITGVHTTEPVVALTFDDGPDPASTPAVAELLDAAGARGTFFMLGTRAAEHPRIVNQVADAGHAIGTHGWEHRSLVLDAPRPWRDAHVWRRELIERGGAALGYGASPLFRPAYGHQNLSVRLTARAAGHRVVGWSVTAGDWSSDGAEAIAARVLEMIGPGSIVLFHDALADAYATDLFDRSTMLRALELVLDALADRFRCVTVPELLEYGPAECRFFYPTPAADILSALSGPA